MSTVLMSFEFLALFQHVFLNTVPQTITIERQWSPKRYVIVCLQVYFFWPICRFTCVAIRLFWVSYFIVFFFWMPLEQSAVWMHCIYLWDTVLLQNVCLCSETKMRSEMLWEPRLDVHNISHMPLIRSVPWCFSLHDSPLVFPKGECWDLCLFMSVWCIRSIFIL